MIFRTLLTIAFVGLASVSWADEKMSQMQLKVKSGLKEIGIEVSDDRIRAASNEDLATALSLMSDDQKDSASPSRRKAAILAVFGE